MINKTAPKNEVKKYVHLPREWPIGKDVLLLHVSSDEQFYDEGIRKGGYVGIDRTLPFEEGKPCAFVRYQNGEPEYRMSRTPVDGYECCGRLSLVVSFPEFSEENV